MERLTGRRRRGPNVVITIVGAVMAVTAIAYVAFRVSPWPSVILIRRAFDRGAEQASVALAPHLPADVTDILDQRYGDDEALLDVFIPAQADTAANGLPAIVWVHGGGFVSGDKQQVGNYARILAGRGFVTVSVGYSIAPTAKFPTPVRQVNEALAYLVANAKRLHIDPTRLFLAGDSGGANTVAQVANAIAEPQYARTLGLSPSIARDQLAGMILFCGPYDLALVSVEGPFGGFLKTVLWAYSGGKDFMTNPDFAMLSVINYVTSAFPPAFISAGNSDPLLPHSVALAEALMNRGVPVDTLFFPADHTPALGHEYQFNLDTDAGRLALERAVAFAATQSK